MFNIMQDTLLNHAFQHASIGMALVSLDGHWIKVNPALCKITGYTEQELLALTFQQITYPDELDVDLHHVQELRQGKRAAYEIEKRYIHKDGHTVWVLLNSAVVRDGNESLCLISQIQDISERKQAEQKLRESEKSYRNLFELCPDMIAIHQDGCFVYINPAGLKLIHASDEANLLGQPILDLVHPDSRELAKQRIIQSYLEGKKAELMQEKFLTLEGQTIDVEVAASPITYDGRPATQVIVRDITERLALEEELRQSHLRIKNILKTAKIGTALSDLETGRLLEADFVFQDMIGCTDEVLRQKFVSEITHPDDIQANMDLRKQLIEGQIDHYQMEKRYIREDGKVVWGNLTCVFHQHPPSIMAMVQDITERKMMENAIQESEEKYRLISENVSDLVAVLDVNGTVVYTSPSHVSELGIDPDQYIGSLPDPYIHPDDLETVRLNYVEMLATGSNRTFEYRWKLADGHWLNLETNAKPVTTADGNITQLVVVSRNVTERKKAELELRESEERFRLIAEYATDMITIRDTAEKYTYVSPACFRLLGFTENELLDRHSDEFIHPDDLAFMQKKQMELLQNGFVTCSHRIRNKNGEYIWFETNRRSFYDSEGIRKSIAVSRDITDRKKLEQQLREAQELWQQLSNMDGLTGIANRRCFDETLEYEWRRSARDRTPLSLILLDIDYFKSYNDTYGHHGGDACLKHVAETIQETLQRPTDLVCRYGGEEFAVILPETNQEGATTVAEKIKAAVENLGIAHPQSQINNHITISGGFTTITEANTANIQDMIIQADKALYLAKNLGRNRLQGYL